MTIAPKLRSCGRTHSSTARKTQTCELAEQFIISKLGRLLIDVNIHQ